MSHIYWKWDKAISKKQCDLIIESIDWETKQEATVLANGFNQIDSKKRKTDIVWESGLSVVGCIADRYIRAANELAGWNFDLTWTDKIQVGKYRDGGFYDWHRDISFENVGENPRKLSFSLLLNDPKDFEGGNFEFKDLPDQPILEQGSIIVFNSFVEHRVTPVTKGSRYSAVTWMHGPKFK
jgi:PKHD-type hydroxylase